MCSVYPIFFVVAKKGYRGSRPGIEKMNSTTTLDSRIYVVAGIKAAPKTNVSSNPEHKN